MAFDQPNVESVVLEFVAPPRVVSYLTPRDRMDVSQLRDQVRVSGYDRMVIHDVEPGETSGVGNFLSLYHAGEPWSRWCFARTGGSLIAWCALSGADIGRFGSLPEALKSVLPGLALPVPEPYQAVVHLRRPTRRFGSAA